MFSARSASAWPSLGGVGLESCTISLRSAMGAAEGTSDAAFFRGAVVGVVALVGVAALGGAVVGGLAPAALA
jgi:hypothetical protein